MPLPALAGLRVLSLESRRSQEMASLIANYGGVPIIAPSMQEVPLTSQKEALQFAQTLVDGGFDMIVLLTGVGTRMLVRVAKTIYPLDKFLAGLKQVVIVARGPKPVAALKELGVTVTLAVPEPNTWRDLLRALDERKETLPLNGKRLAVQEYGASNTELLSGLEARGARVTRVPVYEWSLPADTGPLRTAVHAIVGGEIDIALFTTSVQVAHLLQVAADMNLEEPLRTMFSRVVVGSIGPVTSEALRTRGLFVDFEPSHPKMGFLVAATAEQGVELARRKKNGP